MNFEELHNEIAEQFGKSVATIEGQLKSFEVNDA